MGPACAARWPSRAGPTVPCNNDLLAGNFIDDGDAVWLIDYEYSGNNDACFELGNTATECDLDDDQVEALVDGVLRRARPPMLARVRLQALCGVRLVAVGVHPGRRQPARLRLRRVGPERFEKAARAFARPGVRPTLLEEVDPVD